MPTYEWQRGFRNEFRRLSAAQQAAFLLAVSQFVADLARDGTFRKGLRVKAVRGATGVFEMTWADDGRATFHYGEERRPGEPHIVWRRVGTHAIFDRA